MTCHDHVLSLGVVLYVPEGLGWLNYGLYVICIKRSSFMLWCGSIMVICKHRLCITSPLWAHRAAPYSKNMRMNYEWQ
jgi:hypothetical protein